VGLPGGPVIDRLAREVAEALRTGDTSALNDFEEWRDLDLPDREE